MVALVAVVEADLELDARGDLHLQPVRLAEAEAVDEERVRLVERGRGEHDVPEPDAFGEEPAGHERRRERRRPLGRGRGRPRRARPTGRWSARGARPGGPRTSSSAASDERRSRRPRAGRRRRRTRRRRPPRSRRTRRRWPGPGATMRRCASSVVAPRHRAAGGRLAGHEADDVAEERREDGGVGDLDAEVGELELVSHVGVLRGQRPKRRRQTASACASTTSSAVGSMPASRRHSGASTNIVGPAPVRM